MVLGDVSNNPISDMSLENRGLHEWQNASLRNNAISCLARDFPRVILGERLGNNRFTRADAAQRPPGFCCIRGISVEVAYRLVTK